MTYFGTVKNGVIVLDQEAQLPDGTSVEVRPTTPKNGVVPESSNDDFDLDDLAKFAVDTGIPDLAINHDHYLYGHPKVTDEG